MCNSDKLRTEELTLFLLKQFGADSSWVSTLHECFLWGKKGFGCVRAKLTQLENLLFLNLGIPHKLDVCSRNHYQSVAQISSYKSTQMIWRKATYQTSEPPHPRAHWIFFQFSIFQNSLKIQTCMSLLSSVRWSNRKTWNNDVCVHAPFQDYKCELLTRD